MKKIIATIVCTLCTVVIFAQLVWLSVDKQPFAGTYSRNYHQLLTTWQNQAALAYIPAITAGIRTERRFMLSAIHQHDAGIVLPVTRGGFGLHLTQTGSAHFRQQSIGFAYGRPLGERLSIGTQFSYLSRQVPGYFHAHTIIAELGCLIHLTPQLHAGMHVFNPAGSRLQKPGNEQVPAVYSAGIGYEISAVLLLSAALVKESAMATLTKVMCEYRIIRELSLQLGICTDPQLNTAAVEVSLQQLHIQLSASHHPQLGMTPAASFVWQVKKGH
ncbi:hypothetical protein [Chitinophaga agri]|uniref:Type IX secretion system membrane protein PorP/SprF n=1 Tax=Chitinophaga agri TaxID=2703787 RepID=A0A6B9ZE29_9BACT|nr:hypothetical protein [Chitinophaga agri]QHS60618.1 hypothetical protein GWR21_13745 [Chitinophaga agri]